MYACVFIPLLFCLIQSIHKPLYNTVHYNTVFNITQFKDGSQECIDYTVYIRSQECIDYIEK